MVEKSLEMVTQSLRREREREKWRQRRKRPLGVAGSLSPWLLAWIAATPSGSRPPLVAGSLFLFFVFVRQKSRWRWAVGGSFWAGGLLFGCFIGCFVLILSLCIFLEMLRCQLVSGRQKTLPLCNDCIATTLILIFLHRVQLLWECGTKGCVCTTN